MKFDERSNKHCSSALPAWLIFHQFYDFTFKAFCKVMEHTLPHDLGILWLVATKIFINFCNENFYLPQDRVQVQHFGRFWARNFDKFSLPMLQFLLYLLLFSSRPITTFGMKASQTSNSHKERAVVYTYQLFMLSRWLKEGPALVTA